MQIERMKNGETEIISGKDLPGAKCRNFQHIGHDVLEIVVPWNGRTKLLWVREGFDSMTSNGFQNPFCHVDFQGDESPAREKVRIAYEKYWNSPVPAETPASGEMQNPPDPDIQIISGGKDINLKGRS